jgi:hypothetical protein
VQQDCLSRSLAHASLKRREVGRYNCRASPVRGLWPHQSRPLHPDFWRVCMVKGPVGCPMMVGMHAPGERAGPGRRALGNASATRTQSHIPGSTYVGMTLSPRTLTCFIA